MDIEQRARYVLDGYPDLETESPIREDLDELAEAVLKLRPRVRELEEATHSFGITCEPLCARSFTSEGTARRRVLPGPRTTCGRSWARPEGRGRERRAAKKAHRGAGEGTQQVQALIPNFNKRPCRTTRARRGAREGERAAAREMIKEEDG